MSLDAGTRAALIGALATIVSVLSGLLGVSLTVMWNRKKDRDEKETNLRRSLYVSSIAIMHRSILYLEQKVFETNELKDKEIPSELRIACAQLRMVGSKQVISGAIAFESKFGQLDMQMITAKSMLNDFSAQVEAIKKRIEERIKDFAPISEQRKEAANILKTYLDKREKNPAASPEKEVIEASGVYEKTNAQIKEVHTKLSKEAMEMLHPFSESVVLMGKNIEDKVSRIPMIGSELMCPSG